MNNAEKKYISDEIMGIAIQIMNGTLCEEGAAAKLMALANDLRNEIKEDTAR